MSSVPLHMSTRNRGRLSVGARVFGVSAVTVLAVIERDPAAAVAVLLFAGLAVLATVATERTYVSGTLIATVEALAAAAMIGAQLQDVRYALVYLVVPPFVAGLYAGLADAFVLDAVDARQAGEVAALGLQPVVVPTLMRTVEDAAALAKAALEAL